MIFDSRPHCRCLLTFLPLSYSHWTHQGQSMNYSTMEEYQFQDIDGSEVQGLCHDQIRQWQPQSYLKHVFHTHSYAFTPLHPCLYLAVSLQLPRPKDTEVSPYQLIQDGDILNPRGFDVTWPRVIWCSGDAPLLFLTQMDKCLRLAQRASRNTNMNCSKISDSDLRFQWSYKVRTTDCEPWHQNTTVISLFWEDPGTDPTCPIRSQ